MFQKSVKVPRRSLLKIMSIHVFMLIAYAYSRPFTYQTPDFNCYYLTNIFTTDLCDQPTDQDLSHLSILYAKPRH